MKPLISISEMATRPELALVSSGAYQRRQVTVWRAWLVVWAGLTLLLLLAMLRLHPRDIGGLALAAIAWLVFALGLAAIVYRPRYGIYLILFFSLLGDGILMPAYPFNKNFSSLESLFYVNSSLVFNPLEIYLAATLLSWLVGIAMRRKGQIHSSPLTAPALIFLGFMLFGLLWGLSRGGDVNVAFWEVRSTLYLPLMVLLVTNLFDKREHINTFIWLIMLALFIEALVAIGYVLIRRHGNLAGVQAIAEHSMSIHEATFFVLALSAWLYHASVPKRILLPLLAPIMTLALLYNQRRSSYLVLMLSLGLMLLVFHKLHRRLFWSVVPLLVVVSAMYVAAYWGSTGGTLGIPAQALRSMVAPIPGSQDDLSNIYRILENVNVQFTIRTAPLTGLGFGHKFYVTVPLPDTSTFIWYQYVTHNSILWIWMQAGIGGFFSLIFLIGMAVMTGVRATWRMTGDSIAVQGASRGRDADMAAVGLAATLYIIMHFVYGYIDMSWEAQSLTYVGGMMGVIGVLERLAGSPVQRKAE